MFTWVLLKAMKVVILIALLLATLEINAFSGKKLENGLLLGFILAQKRPRFLPL